MLTLIFALPWMRPSRFMVAGIAAAMLSIVAAVDSAPCTVIALRDMAKYLPAIR